MTRDEAVAHFWSLSDRVDNEYCAGKSESDRLHAETEEAFRALGLTDDEIDW